MVEPARSRPLDAESVRAHADCLGQTPFAIAGFRLSLEEGRGLGFSTLHHVRAQALELLSQQLLAPWEDRRLPKVIKEPAPKRKEVGKCTIAVWATNSVCARAAKRAGASEPIVPPHQLPSWFGPGGGRGQRYRGRDGLSQTVHSGVAGGAP